MNFSLKVYLVDFRGILLMPSTRLRVLHLTGLSPPLPSIQTCRGPLAMDPIIGVH